MTIQREYRQCPSSPAQCPFLVTESPAPTCCVCGGGGWVGAGVPPEPLQMEIFPQILLRWANLAPLPGQQIKNLSMEALGRPRGSARDIVHVDADMLRNSWLTGARMRMLEVPKYKYKNNNITWLQDLKLWLEFLPVSLVAMRPWMVIQHLHTFVFPSVKWYNHSELS